MNQQKQLQTTNYKCFESQVLLIEGGTQIYRCNMLKTPVTLETMIPLENQPLKQASTDFFNYLVRLNKQRYEAKDIWKGLLLLNYVDLIKCFVCYGLSSSAFLFYSIASIYLFEIMYGEKQIADFGHIYRLVSLLCSVWFFQGIFYGMGYKLLGVMVNNQKRVLFYSIYVRLLTHESRSLRGESKGKLLNSLTEFHDMLQDSSSYLIEVIGSSISIIGIFVILLTKLGWLGLLLTAYCILLIAGQYFYSDYNSGHLQVVAKLKDKRMSYLSEIISFLKYIKMQRWEGLFFRRVSQVRGEQYKSNIKYGSGSGIQQVIQACQAYPVIILSLVIVTSFTSTQVNSKFIAIISVLVFMLQKSFLNMSLAIKSYFQVLIVFERTAQFFNLQYSNKQIQDDSKQKESQKISFYEISLNEVSYSYQQNEVILDYVSLNVARGEFVTIIGEIGSGKTTLLDCISSQITTIKGSLRVSKQLVYLQQQPPIFSGLLRDNITQNKPFQEQFYNRVVELCCLSEDFSSLQNGDQTYIEEKLTNLSGGQKARIALARTLYSKSKVLLLDDPLSSLDVKVGQRIFNNLIGLCKAEEYTVVMTLHQINFITEGNTVYVLENSRLRNLAVQQISQLHVNQNQQTSLKKSITQENTQDFYDLNQEAADNDNLSQPRSLNQDYELQVNSHQNSLSQRETPFFKALLSYLFNCRANYLFATLTGIAFLSINFFLILMFQLLGKYDELRLHSPYFPTFTSFIVVIGLLTCVYLLNIWLKIFLLHVSIQNSNKQIFKDLTCAVMKSSLSYYTKRSSGEMLEKYSVNLGSLESTLGYNIQQYLNTTATNISAIVYLIIYKPILAIPLLLVVASVYWIHRYCAPVVLAQRQQSLLHKGAPLITHFEETIKGLKTIQSYKLQQRMRQKMAQLLQNSTKSCLSYHKTLISYFVYSKHLSNLIIAAIFFLLVKLSESNIKNIFYPMLSLFDLSWSFYYIFASSLCVNSVLVSKQKISDFICQINKFKQSINLHITPEQIMKNAQSFENAIQIRNLTLRYNQNSPPALRNVTVSIKRGKKVAIVGRTGSGKSSFVQALYRLVQPDSQSSYFVNGRNAMEHSLEQLRGCFSCIPQQPFVFNDTLRRNVDPFGLYSDREIEGVLSKLGLLEIVAKSQKGLNSSIEHKQISFSYGQTQLICLARVILQRKGIVVMDEAASNVDEKTDAVINSVVKEQLKGRTLITIAHKLLTILDYDTILVFERGEIVQRGTAVELIQQRKVFYEMIQENPQIAERCYKMLVIQPYSKLNN